MSIVLQTPCGVVGILEPLVSRAIPHQRISRGNGDGNMIEGIFRAKITLVGQRRTLRIHRGHGTQFRGIVEKSVCSESCIDFCFLGMGDDCHTVTLFHPALLLDEPDDWFATVGVPGKGWRFSETNPVWLIQDPLS